MKSLLNFCDNMFIGCARACSIPFARFSLFVVFFWFGILKVIGESPANPLVSNLLESTMPFISFETFIFIFGVFEVVIGLSFLFPRLVRVSVAMLAFHMVTTFMPLILLPEITWQRAFIPTIEGQYIIKNLVIIAAALGIVSHMHLPHNERPQI
jgi:uncharacterized membrane protein YkgB